MKHDVVITAHWNGKCSWCTDPITEGQLIVKYQGGWTHEPCVEAQRAVNLDQITTSVTLEEIEAGKTPAGGWTKEQLARWGVPWPPPRGWKERLARR